MLPLTCMLSALPVLSRSKLAWLQSWRGCRAYLRHKEQEGDRTADGSDSQKGKGVGMDAGAWRRPPEAQAGSTRQQQHACLLTICQACQRQCLIHQQLCLPACSQGCQACQRQCRIHQQLCLPAHRDVKQARASTAVINSSPKHSDLSCRLLG